MTSDMVDELLVKTVVPRLAAEGKFGADVRLVSVTAEPVGGLGVDHWASTTLRMTLTLQPKESGTEAERKESVVVKCMLPGDGFEGYNLPDAQSANEVTMYMKMFPFFARLSAKPGESMEGLHPKCFHAQSEDLPAKLMSLTFLEDLRGAGFGLSKERCWLDRRHAALALRALGRLHAHSHAAKARCRGEFLALVGRLRESSYTPETQPRWTYILRRPVLRGLQRLADRLAAQDGDDEQRDERLRRLRRVEARLVDPFVVMADAVADRDPATAVIVHGDFCRNNMMFRYDASGQPVEVRLFDFQNSRFCSPSVDLAFFLFLNTSHSLRATHWDGLLADYFDSMQSTLQDLLAGHELPEDFVMPTLQAVRADLKRHALWGYVISSFFLPQMMVKPEEMTCNGEEMKDLAARDLDKAVEVMLSIGGEKATDVLADMLLEYLDRDLVP